MASYNRVIIMGNLTRDPELKQLSSGQSVCRLGLASNRQFKNRQTGQTVQEVCFVDIDVWGAQADSCQQYLQKGRAVLVEGRLKLDTWMDNEGQRKSKHSIVADRVTFLSSGTSVSDDEQSQSYGDNASTKSGPSSSQISKAAEDIGTPEVKQETSSNDNAAEKIEAAPNTGEVNLSKDKPFEDDLPF